MPGLHGFELTRRLRALAPKAALIAMSATPPTTDQSAGFDAFLLKPFDADAFDAALTSAGDTRAVSTPHAALPDLDDAIFERLGVAMHPDDLARLFAVALTDTRSRAADIESAIAAGDDATLRAQAHAIKGSAAMLGARALADAASRLEHTGIQPDARPQLAQILACATRLEGILLSRIPRPSGDSA
jgi:HPt (histidine-containing phosphotransfer) domain-containing protein